MFWDFGRNEMIRDIANFVDISLMQIACETLPCVVELQLLLHYLNYLRKVSYIQKL